jgi:hypothetical protein
MAALPHTVSPSTFCLMIRLYEFPMTPCPYNVVRSGRLTCARKRERSYGINLMILPDVHFLRICAFYEPHRRRTDWLLFDTTVVMAISSTTTNASHAVNGEISLHRTRSYQYSHQYLKRARPIKVIVVGCGVSGIAAVKMFKDRFQGLPVQLTIYEKNSSVGGTWFENRYPGQALLAVTLTLDRLLLTFRNL